MEPFFNINFEFDKGRVYESIDKALLNNESTYICVADGNILANVHQSEDYKKIVNSGLFSICDGHWTTIYLRWIYGIKRDSYCGSEIFIDLLKKNKYSMVFLGGSQEALKGIERFVQTNYTNHNYYFADLPFKSVDEFDYKEIGEKLNQYGADIIWVGLGAPKQEIFMNRLRPYLNQGVMIGVGAVFNFYGSQNVNRAPSAIRALHLEWLYRVTMEPKRQFPKFKNYLKTIPQILIEEIKNKNK